MDEKWKKTMDDLERIWPRVDPMGPPPPPPPPAPGHGPGPEMPPPPPVEREDARELGSLIGMEAEAERLYSAMAARTKGRGAQTLRSLSASSRRLVRMLQTEYDLRTGNSRPLPKHPERIASLPEALRRAWQDAQAAERAYRDAAGQTRDPELRELYGDAAAVKQRQRRVLRELANRVF